MNHWKEQFNDNFCAEVMGKIQPHLWGHAHTEPEDVRKFISTEIIEKLMVDVLTRIHEPKLRESLKQQLRDKWL